ncbi:MAG: hypothetical protein A2V76_01360 [Candidatus Aminicenantes bacterium RBG_16_63_14]|nr:MAG: hypothetical protein A2V76_01360 [Candidatus Aminicenantes bacterium RBG_16_63_14]
MIAFLTLAFTLAIVGPALAEDPAAAAAQGQIDETKNYRNEIVKLKYIRAQDIQAILYTFTSRKGAHLQFAANMPQVLSVSDTPENVEKILAAIRELDVKPADVLYTVQLVLGSEADAATDAELQTDPIVKELRKLLRYKGYTLLDSSLVRVINRERAEVILGPKAEFEFGLRPDVAGDAKSPVIKTEVRLRQITRQKAPEGKEGIAQPIAGYANLIESTLNIKSGDRTVVGVSKLDGGDKGLILIISAKIVD